MNDQRHRRGPRWLAGAALAALVVAACGREDRVDAEYFVFGTRVTLSLRDVDRATADRAISQVGAYLQACHDRWHAWEDSAVTRLNASIASGEEAAVDAELLDLLRISRSLEDLSDGLFNPAIGGLVRLWGFHTSDYPVTGPPPDEAAIADWVERAPSMLDLHLDGDTVRSRNTAVQLDFGAVAKGYAIDQALDLLAGLGIDDAMLEAGGDLGVRVPEDGAPWRVGIRDPFAAAGDDREGPVIGGIEMRDGEAVFTSGNTHRYRADAGERWPHIIDPRTGWPVTELAAVTVLDQDATRADAAATALVVAGRGWREVAARMGMRHVLVVGADGALQATPAMADRLELVPATRQRLEVVPLTATG